MKPAGSWFWIGIAMACLLIMTGCGKKADEDKSVAKSINDIKTEASKMDADSLRNMAMKYKKAIQDKMHEAEQLTNKIKEIPVNEMMGDEAQKLKKEMETVTGAINSLKERFMVYVNELKKKGEDLSGLDL